MKQEQIDHILTVNDVHKSFSGVKALNGVSFSVKRGTVHALMGENGAGKSTMMKILLGVYSCEKGKIVFDNHEVNYKSPREALNDGIAMIHQELSSVQDLKVYECIYLGKEITYGKTLLNNQRAMQLETKKIFNQLDIEIDPDAKMKTLSIAKQQMCEIAKAVSFKAKLIIMDEPTSAITESEVKHLFRIIQKLRENDVSIIYITHKMDEVFEIADEISVFRDGCYIGTHMTKEISKDQLIKMMVGRTINNLFPKETVELGEVYLEVKGLSRKGEFEDISFDVRCGEVFGLAGLMGAGRSEVVETLFGVRKKTAGKIYIAGKEVRIKSPRDAIRLGFSLVTEDRKRSGCFLPLSVKLNTVVASLSAHSSGPFILRKVMKNSAENIRKLLNIKTKSIETIISHLSGGNQQKVLVGRWLLTKPEIPIFDEPTRGIDVGSKVEIHKLINGLAKQGKCVIIVSSEMPELIGMCDRILVMSEGREIRIINRTEFSQEKILRYATGTI